MLRPLPADQLRLRYLSASKDVWRGRSMPHCSAAKTTVTINCSSISLSTGSRPRAWRGSEGGSSSVQGAVCWLPFRRSRIRGVPGG